MIHVTRPPLLLRQLIPGLVWRMPASAPVLYLTFDDGPVPEVTPQVLDILAAHNVKATFFCVGDNVQKHPEIFQRLLSEGHAVGNHTQHHRNGWNSTATEYYRDVAECAALVPSKLFRPPYGRIGRSQASRLRRKYSIIMWDVLTGDYDVSLSGEDCLGYAVEYSRAGSIVVFHDSIKAKDRVLYALPRYLELMKEKGFRFEVIRSAK